MGTGRRTGLAALAPDACLERVGSPLVKTGGAVSGLAPETLDQVSVS
jgi:hypothetical protein